MQEATETQESDQSETQESDQLGKVDVLMISLKLIILVSAVVLTAYWVNDVLFGSITPLWLRILYSISVLACLGGATFFIVSAPVRRD